MTDKLIRVLIADDNANFTEILKDCLKDQVDIEVVGIAKDGNEAVDMIIKNAPDVAIIDIIMPHLDGIGILEKINSLYMKKRPLFIMLSAVDQTSVLNWALSSGADYYVTKPFDIDVLASRIRQLYDRSRGLAVKNDLSSENKISNNIEVNVTRIMHEIYIPAHIKGYQYIRVAIIMVITDASIIKAITNKLYPSIAEKYSTTPRKVEHAMHYAIEVSFSRVLIEKIDTFLGYSIKIFKKGKPTISEFIAIIADKIKLEMNIV